MSWIDTVSDVTDYVSNKVDRAFAKATPKWVPNELRDTVKVAAMGPAGAGMMLNDYGRKQGWWGTGTGAGGNQDYYGGGGFEFPMVEFTPIEPLGEINVNALLEEMTTINRKTTETNFGIAQTMGRQVADNAFTDFTAFLDKLLPEASGLTRSVARQAQAYIDRGLPDAVMGNAILRDSAMFNATGTRGDVAVRRGLANDAARDSAGVQYGIGLAQQLVNDSRATALPFAQLGAEATQNNLGLLTSLTTLSPAQRVGFAFDERNYQTSVMQFNASGGLTASQANASLGMQQQQLNMEMAMYQDTLARQQKAAEDAKKTALWSTLGTVGGAVIGTVIAPGVGTMMGAQIGGGLGQMAGGQQTGNYSLMSQGMSTGAGAYGTYSSWQSQQQNLAMQNQMLGLQQQQLNQSRYTGSTGQPMWRY